MARKELDKLSLDMIQCEKDGYGVHYGRWKAMQQPVKVVSEIPDGWKRCPQCGKPFKPRCGKKYCDEVCRKQAYIPKEREIFRKYMNGYRERKKANEG